VPGAAPALFPRHSLDVTAITDRWVIKSDNHSRTFGAVEVILNGRLAAMSPLPAAIV